MNSPFIPHTARHQEPESSHSRSSFVKEVQQMLACVGGIYIFYLLFGFYQEEIMSKRWGPKEERFNYTSFLLLIQSVVNAISAGLVLLVAGFEKDKTPFHKYAQVSISSIAAMFCSNRALLYVDYPTQVLAKSCKPIPVMLMGVIAFKKRYPLVKYLCVLMVAIGIGLFMMPSKGHSHKADAKESDASYLLGIGLLIGSLALDGTTGPFQDNLIKKYKPSSVHMMYYSNIWASIVLFIMIVVLGDLMPAINFCMQYPDIIVPIGLFSICSAFGQNFIYYTIHKFGSLTCTTVTTTRKFFTILASVIYFGHDISIMQWFSVLLVFVGLIVDSIYSYLRKKQEREANKHH